MNPPARDLTLTAADGYRLGARLFHTATAPRARLAVAGATGVPQGFYRRFAEAAAAAGFETLTLDYRGVGLSRPASLKGFQMDYRDWARLDLAAAVDHLAGDGTLPLFVVGHSYGGQALGLLPNHHKVNALYTFGTGAGWAGWMPRSERAKVWLMWNVIGPLLVRWKGYLAWSLLGMGEDLPLPVYRQWRQWCAHPRYFFDDPASAPQQLAQSFAAVRTPIMAVNSTDDLWAPPRSRDAFMAGYRHAPVQGVDLEPRRAGLAPLGHMGYFRPAGQALWQPVFDWFGQHLSPAARAA
jgi:predicted alpha/beta hydrolase